ncbi:hypothetical protein [Streptomyces turgidiscabies]|uniref:hypothetical protein n=1 Tax=Streptomyces turgidiscabies TaxID=85558 RepID=UPI0038F60547
MRTYQGSATVSVEGVEYEVEAVLWSDAGHLRVVAMGDVSSVKGLGSWGGTLDTDDEEAGWNILNGGVMRLQLRDAGEGEFLASSGSVGGPVQITGNGEPPF